MSLSPREIWDLAVRALTELRDNLMALEKYYPDLVVVVEEEGDRIIVKFGVCREWVDRELGICGVREFYVAGVLWKLK